MNTIAAVTSARLPPQKPASAQPPIPPGTLIPPDEVERRVAEQLREYYRQIGEEDEWNEATGFGNQFGVW